MWHLSTLPLAQQLSVTCRSSAAELNYTQLMTFALFAEPNDKSQGNKQQVGGFDCDGDTVLLCCLLHFLSRFNFTNCLHRRGI